MDQTHPSVGQLPSYAGGSPFKGFWIRFVAAMVDFVILVAYYSVFEIKDFVLTA